jgi:hypothetical protein
VSGSHSVDALTYSKLAARFNVFESPSQPFKYFSKFNLPATPPPPNASTQTTKDSTRVKQQPMDAELDSARALEAYKRLKNFVRVC